MFHFNKLSSIMLISMMGIAIVIVLPMSFVLYNAIHTAEMQKIKSVSEAALKPITSLATRSINGANKMKLRNKDAQALYASANLLFIKISGMSKKVPKSAFADAQPPRKIEVEFRPSGDDTRIEKAISSSSESFIDEKNLFYFSHTKLNDVENGAEVIAVFSADSLKGLQLRILKKIALPIIFIMIFASVIAIFLGRFIARPIASSSKQIGEISHTLNLTDKVSSNSKIVEIKQTEEMFNLFLTKVEAVIVQLDKLVLNLFQSSELLASNTTNTLEKVQSQNEQTNLVATAITEMSAVVEIVEQNAETANSETTSANNEAMTGQSIVNESIAQINQIAQGVDTASKAIERVNQDSLNIGKVLDVIRGISEQTNLLALNAAIEAARAGETGRGFAVVADEVRTLASRTHESTVEIQQMVEQLQTGVTEANSAIMSGKAQTESAVEKAGEAGQSLQRITQAVSAISEMNEQIAHSTKEQSTVTSEVQRNVIEFSELTRQISDDTNASAQTSVQLNEIANQLKELISTFKINH